MQLIFRNHHFDSFWTQRTLFCIVYFLSFLEVPSTLVRKCTYGPHVPRFFVIACCFCVERHPYLSDGRGATCTVHRAKECAMYCPQQKGRITSKNLSSLSHHLTELCGVPHLNNALVNSTCPKYGPHRPVHVHPLNKQMKQAN